MNTPMCSECGAAYSDHARDCSIGRGNPGPAFVLVFMRDEQTIIDPRDSNVVLLGTKKAIEDGLEHPISSLALYKSEAAPPAPIFDADASHWTDPGYQIARATFGSDLSPAYAEGEPHQSFDFATSKRRIFVFGDSFSYFAGMPQVNLDDLVPNRVKPRNPMDVLTIAGKAEFDRDAWACSGDVLWPIQGRHLRQQLADGLHWTDTGPDIAGGVDAAALAGADVFTNAAASNFADGASPPMTLEALKNATMLVKRAQQAMAERLLQAEREHDPETCPIPETCPLCRIYRSFWAIGVAG